MTDVFNVMDYGAVGNGVADDLPAFKAAIRAMGPLPTCGPNYTRTAWHGKILFVPAGTYRMSGPLHLTRSLKLVGTMGNGWYSSSCLVFDKGCSGVVFEQLGCTAASEGSWSIMQDLCIAYAASPLTDSGPIAPPPKWTPSTHHNVGDVITAAHYLKYGPAFRCAVAGTTGTAEPIWPNPLARWPRTWAAVPWMLGEYTRPTDRSVGHVFKCVAPGTAGSAEPAWNTTPGSMTLNGSVTWQEAGLYPDLWVPCRSYAVGDVVQPTSDFLRKYVCITAGTADNFEPIWPHVTDETTMDGSVVWKDVGPIATWTDGTVEWEMIQAHGVQMSESSVMDNCSIFSFPGHNVNLQAAVLDIPATSANKWSIRNVFSEWAGGSGFFCAGTDVNAGVAIGLQCAECRGYGIDDQSFLANTFVGCMTQDNETGSYRSITSLFLGCYAEGGQAPAAIGRSAQWFGGAVGGLFTNFFRTSWAPNVVHQLNDYIMPTIANMSDGGTDDYVYKAIGVVGPGGATEPVWPKGIGKTVTDAGIIWQCYATALFSDGNLQIGPINQSPQSIVGYSGTKAGMETRLGPRENGLSFFGWKNLDEASSWDLVRDGSGTGWDCFKYANSLQALAFSGSRAAVGPGKLKLPGGFYLGTVGAFVSSDVRSYGGPPTTGTHRAGEWQLMGDQGVPGGNVGWVCVVGGTPGTWVPFGEVVDLNILNFTITGGGAAYQLTGPQAAHRIIRMVGTLMGDAVVKFGGPGTYYFGTQHAAIRTFRNDTTGPFAVTIKHSDGNTGIVLPQGKSQMIWTDDVDVYPAAPPV